MSYFVGTGGGNDVFSTILAILTLKQHGWEWDSCSIAGVLSPFHHHTCTQTEISGVTKINPDSTRLVWRKNDSFPIGFIDATVAHLVQTENTLGISQVLGISLTHGSIGVSRIFRELSDTYDYIVLVDVGGDILYRGNMDTHVLSPMFDAMVLRGFLDANVPGILFEAGPGTDGELDPKALESALSAAEAQAYLLPVESLDQWDAMYQTWIAPIRTGRTVPMTIEAYRSKKNYISHTYRARAHLGKERLYTDFKQKIKTSLCKQFFLIDPINITNPFAVRCSDPIAWFLDTQVGQHRTNCEPNLEYYQNGTHLYQFLTPSILFSEPDRSQMINKGLEDLLADSYDRALVFPSDWQRIESDWNDKVTTKNTHGLVIVSKS